jgi:hypothetical protein
VRVQTVVAAAECWNLRIRTLWFWWNWDLIFGVHGGTWSRPEDDVAGHD